MSAAEEMGSEGDGEAEEGLEAVGATPADDRDGLPSDLPLSPDERVFQAHLERAEYLVAVRGRRWRLISLEWPVCTFAVAAAPRENAPAEFSFRLDVGDYPRQAPHGQLWDMDGDAPLAHERRPKGERASLAFKEWAGIYLPIDRSAIGATLIDHAAWRSWRWNDGKDITFYLRLLHELLNADDYTGV